MTMAAVLKQENKRGQVISFQDWKSDHKTAVKVPSPILDDDYKADKKAVQMPVEPLSREHIAQLRNYFFNNADYFTSMPTNRRNYLYIVLAANLARRGGDMVRLRVCDVLEADGTIKDHIVFEHEQKTGKRSIMPLNSRCKEALAEYFNTAEEYKMSDWLFQNYKKKGQHMTVDGMRRMLQRTCEKLNIDIHVGTHSLRKAIPYEAISNSTNTADEVLVAQILNHSNIKTTYHYIGRSQEEVDSFMEQNGI